MPKLLPTLLLLLCLAFTLNNSATARNQQTHKIGHRLSQALGFKSTNPRSLTQLLLTGILTCQLFACSSPILYDIGILTISSKEAADITSTTLLKAQHDFDQDTEGTKLIRQHVYVHKPAEFGHTILLAKVVQEKNGLLVIHGYNDKFDITLSHDDIAGYLVDGHPNVGRHTTIPSEEVGFLHYNGTVFAVYSNNIHAVKITSKTSVAGEQQELHKKKDAPHIRLIHENQLD